MNKLQHIWPSFAKRKALESELERKSAVLSTQQETSLDAILLVDEHAHIISYNRQFVQMWRISDELVEAGVDEPVLRAVVAQIDDPEVFVARVKHLYEHRNEKAREELRTRDGRTIDRYTAPVVSPDGEYYGRVWYFRDITERRQTEDALRRIVAQLNEAQRVGQIGSWQFLADSGAVTWSEQLFRIFGLDPALPVPGVAEHERILTSEALDRTRKGIAWILKTGQSLDTELELIRPDGTKGWLWARGEALRDSTGRIIGATGTSQEITERKRVDATLRRANRALRVISSVGHARIRGESEQRLLETVCNVLLEHGGYRMAWIGFVEHDENQTIRPVAYSGYEAGYLENAAITWADSERGRGPTGTAARTGTVQIARDIGSDPRMAAWREDAVTRGYASSIALPLANEAGTLGVLTIYAEERDAFDLDEVMLLQELAADLAFGIVTHRSNQERLRAEALAKRLATFDSLTGLPNRVQLIAHLKAAVDRARAHAESLALLTVRLDRFSEIQDGIGFAGADVLLKTFSTRLGGATSEDDFIARIDTASFAIVIPRANAGRAREIALNLYPGLQAAFEYAGVPIDVQATIGVSVFPDHGDADALLRRGSIAVRQAQAKSVDYGLYSGEAETESPQRLILLAELRRAIKADGLQLFYQPKIDLMQGTIAGVEALVRWPHPERGMVPPDHFIRLAEQTGLIRPITRWVLDAALKQIFTWQQLGIEIPIAINVSPINLRDPEFLAHLEALRSNSPAALDLLQIELTETALMSDPVKSREVLARIRELGIDIFIDDFGTGHSSLGYIATLPIHALKIPLPFVRDMMQHARHRAVVMAAISLAHSLGMKVVAEGIETADQAKALLEMGCDELQGFFFSKPIPAEDFLLWRAKFGLEQFGLARAKG